MLRSRLSRLMACLWLLLSLPCTAQQPVEPPSPAQFDPSDVYFQGYLETRAAERLESSGDFIAAAEKYRSADELFATILKYYPDWKSGMVKRRAAKTTEALAGVRQKADDQLKEKRSVVAELEGGVRMGTTTDPDASTPNILKVDPVTSRRLTMAQQEVERLKGLLAQQEVQASRDTSQQAVSKRQEQEAARQLAAAQAEIKRLQALAAIQQHNKQEAERLARQLVAERAKVDQLRQQALQSEQQSEAERHQWQQQNDKALAAAQAEIRELRRAAIMERSRTESEIARLRKLTGEMESEAEAKIAQLQEIARAAKENAAKEVGRLEKLTGEARQQAEQEIVRLGKVSAQAQAQAQAEINQLREMTAKTRTESQGEIERLREMADKAKQEADARQLELDLAKANSRSQINELSRNRTLLESRLQAAQNDVRQLKAKLAKAPLESEVEALNHKITRLEQERQAMGLALRQSQNGYTEAVGRISALEKDLTDARQQAANFKRDLNAQRDAANAVVAGQSRQLEALQKQLAQKSTALTAANDEINRLKRDLNESKDAFALMRKERDALMLERDQMAALLRLNEDGRIQDLIEQNMGLAKQLREANEKLDRIHRESSSDKDAITEALRDLAIAKSQINRLHQEKRDQEKRISELEESLKHEQRALASGEASSDPAEVAVLRDIISRQLRMQTRRRQARELLINAVKKLGSQDEQLAEAVELLDSQEMSLTPDEQKIIADRRVDGEFVSPFARSRSAVNEATSRLNQDIAVFDRTARKAFLAGRLRPTRELYEMILEQHPGHTPTLCKIGIVHLKLNEVDEATDAFRRAAELDKRNSYALRMLSYSLMKGQQFKLAEEAARESVSLDPNDAKAHILLATLCCQLGKTGEAESHFKGAINADPMPSEPYYNLALIYASSGRIDLARQYYHQALERGALPDSILENTLSTP